MILEEQKGFGILGAMISLAILLIIVQAASSSMSQAAHSRSQAVAQKGAIEIEDLMRSSVIRKVSSLVQSNTCGSINNGLLNAALNDAVLGPNVTISLVTSSNQIQAPAQSPSTKYSGSFNRCNNDSGIDSNLNGLSSIYFCIKLQDSTTPLRNRVLKARTSFIEFKYSFWDWQNDQQITCNQYRTNILGSVGSILHYNIGWERPISRSKLIYLTHAGMGYASSN